MEYTPPPFFKRGPSLIARLSFFVLLSLVLLYADARFHYMEGLRKAIGVVLPDTMDLKVVDTEPTVQKATASAVMKAAKLETGLTIQVPPFVNTGDKVRVDTSEARYVQRV